jgi:hypothetical protein
MGLGCWHARDYLRAALSIGPDRRHRFNGRRSRMTRPLTSPTGVLWDAWTSVPCHADPMRRVADG